MRYLDLRSSVQVGMFSPKIIGVTCGITEFQDILRNHSAAGTMVA